MGKPAQPANENGIETNIQPGQLWMPGQIGLGTFVDADLLARLDRPGGQLLVGPGLDFDEGQQAPPPGDDVDLAGAASATRNESPLKNPPTFEAQIPDRRLFGPLAQSMRRHFLCPMASAWLYTSRFGRPLALATASAASRKLIVSSAV